MNKLFVGILSLLICAGATQAQVSGSRSSTDSIVFVDLERVFNEFYKTKLAKSHMEVLQKDVESERLILVEDMNVISASVDELKKEARDVTLNEDIRNSKRILFEERLLELRAKQKEIEEFVARRKKQLQQQVARMSQRVMDEIRETIVNYSKKEGLMAVMDNSSRRAAVGVFIYTHPNVQITDDILTILNSKRPDNLDVEGLFDDGSDLAE